MLGMCVGNRGIGVMGALMPEGRPVEAKEIGK